MDRYKKYNKKTKIILEKYQEGDVIPFEIYGKRFHIREFIVINLLH